MFHIRNISLWMVIIGATFRGQNKKLHVLGKTPTPRSTAPSAYPVECNFLLCDGDLSAFSRHHAGLPGVCPALIRPEKFIFDRAHTPSILHSIKGTLFLIWNIRMPVRR
ncbi:hypothetical protein BCEN4_70038 [Burkholderia cenocepacia]|nr:hypothetical protein BCEN4_70038 [Burkholderia cenocepacia]